MLTKLTNELQEYICDNLCKYPWVCREEQLMKKCEECQIDEFVNDIQNVINGKRGGKE